jgi:NCAIR mutase (PurE)-related protein
MPTPSPTPQNASSQDPAATQHDQEQPAQSQDEWRNLLTRLASGQASVAEVLAAVSPQPPTNAVHSERISQDPKSTMAPIDGATVDLGRQQRCGFGEVIYGEGKPPELIARIARTQIDAKQNVLVTRIENTAAEQAAIGFDHSVYNAVARTLRISHQPIVSASPQTSASAAMPHVAVVTAGSTDAPVASEAIETLAWMGIPFTRFEDIGVAGPQRLVNAVPALQKANAVIVVAGMEGALPSVVSGHLSVPLFAVPTSVGYGATLAGLTPLLGMLSSCAAGVAVVNIDAGFKAGYMAGLVIDQVRRANNAPAN